MFNSEELEKKWAPILEAPDAPAFADAGRKSVCAVLLENQEQALREERSQSNFLAENTVAGDVQNWDPVLISLVRRAMPNLIAYDVCGVQPMTGPTGLIFAMKARYQTNTDGSANTGADTAAAHGSPEPEEALFDYTDGTKTNYSGSQTTAVGETTDGTISREMGFTVDKLTVTAKTRALKAEYTMELAQDLKSNSWS